MVNDPATLTVVALGSAAGGAIAAEVGKDAYSLLKRTGKSTFARVLKRLRGPALEQATRNLHQFDTVLTKVQARDAIHQTGQGRSFPDPAIAIEDPDKFHAFLASAHTAARTSSEERHRILAEALSMRFRAPTHDSKAVVMTRAIEVLPLLSGDHLAVLGGLAVVHAVRPKDPRITELKDKVAEIHRRENEVYPRNKPKLDSLKGEERAAAATAHNEEFEAVAAELRPVEDELFVRYSDQAAEIVGSIRLHAPNWDNLQQDVMHLVAAGCLNLERSVFRDLPEQFAEQDPAWGYVSLPRTVRNSVSVPELASFLEGWTECLQHCSLTPTGLILGLMVHDLRAGTRYAPEWEWGTLVLVDRPKEDWNGLTPHEITERIVKETKRSINDDLRWSALARGVPPSL